MSYKYKYESNIGGNDGIWEFDTEEEAVRSIDQVMQSEYDRYCDKYPNADVTWLNRLLDCGDETEIYVPNTDEYVRIKIMW